MIRMHSWGRLTHDYHEVIPLLDRHHQLPRGESSSGLPRGLGRSYGDSCQNAGNLLWQSSRLDRFISFDVNTGLLRCEAGITLREIQRIFAPRGWFLPVTPGTQYVTVGGAIANDVHGKNHHQAGSFGNHTERFLLARTDGELLQCSSEENPGYFFATIGGLGLTGVILEASLTLKKIPGYMIQEETLPFHSLEEFFSLSDSSENAWEYTVAWFDCLHPQGRGLFTRGNHASHEPGLEPGETVIPVFFTPPVSLVNRASIGIFNWSYFQKGRGRSGKRVLHYRPFLYPLDNVKHMNRIYGPHGFYQYQCVIPFQCRLEVTLELLQLIHQSGMGSFLSVLKSFGPIPSKGLLSFPSEGVTLALDFPNKGERLLALFEKLDAVVLAAGGRVYLAKDARLSTSTFEKMYPRLNDFTRYRDSGISSSMSRRLTGV